MTLIKTSKLPAFEHIEATGIHLETNPQNSPTTNIAFLNMMPDAALEATERQFIRLLGKVDTNKKICFYPFTLNHIKRSPKAQEHIAKYYSNFSQLQKLNLDALIISGANVPTGEMTQAPFWKQLTDIFSWLLVNPIPTLFTCLASHCAIEYYYHQKRQLLPKKCWGVFEHQVDQSHPLTKGLPKTIDIPHSRMNQISYQQMLDSGIKILITSQQIGPHMAISTKHPNFLFFQGHPEYDSISLFKEYKREINNFLLQKNKDYPPFPENYFLPKHKTLLETYRKNIITSKISIQDIKSKLSLLPEKEISKEIKNNWQKSAEIVIKNWINLF
jgi:homoserine O-succinyltransferase